MYFVHFNPLKDLYTHISVHTHTQKIDVYNYTRNGKHMDLPKTREMHEIALNILL